MAGASSTGWGESIMKIQMTGTVVRWLEFNSIPASSCAPEKKKSLYYTHKQFYFSQTDDFLSEEQKAVERVIEYLDHKVDGLGGLILLSKSGNYAISHNTDKVS